jgi:Holliday junction resolvasome RuvABC endonuclease subunit
MFTALALDLGSNCGYAKLEGRVVVESGTVKFSVSRDLPHPDGRRLINFHNWLTQKIEGGVSEVIFENVNWIAASVGARKKNQIRSETSIIVYYTMLGILQMVCAQANIPLFSIQNTTLKARFAGNGKATKEQMCARAHALGWTGGAEGTDLSNDEADAIALLYARMQEYGEEIYL